MPLQYSSVESVRPAQFVYGGLGTAIAQHGELFQGAICDEHGSLHRCLVSLPCPRLYSKGKFVSSDCNGVVVVPANKQKACCAAALTLTTLGAPFKGGILTLESNIPEGKGLGSSTADCTAAVLAVSAALQRRLAAHETAELVVRAETASGNIMFERVVLFAHREGKVLEQYLHPLPRMVMLGFDSEAERIVETLHFPPAVYSTGEVEKFKVLTAALRRAIQTQDVRLLGRVATASAEINQRFLVKPLFREICDVMRESDALGVAVAHSGTVVAILFDYEDPGRERKITVALKLLASLKFVDVLRFEN
jgi:uncharacterized protein involved in propanediol utilization